MLNENQIKALSCTIPFIYGIYECEFSNNQITDIMSTLLLMAAFINPSVKRFSFVGNYARQTFKKTYQDLVVENPRKFTELNLSRSVLQLEVLEQISRKFSLSLVKLNISGCGLSINACRILSVHLLKQE